ncbi:MAG: response regulator [Anaerolineae bacterium]|nr:response regulator [Phycisphaerae bacterium]
MRAGTVMVVDDDESVRTSLARLLKSAGMSFELFASAEEFVAQHAIDSAGCVIIDVQLPGICGLELQAMCAQAHPATPIIMITAFRDPNAEEQALAAGAVEFFHKPFDAGALIEAVTEAIEHQQ